MPPRPDQDHLASKWRSRDLDPSLFNYSILPPCPVSTTGLSLAGLPWVFLGPTPLAYIFVCTLKTVTHQVPCEWGSSKNYLVLLLFWSPCRLLHAGVESWRVSQTLFVPNRNP